MKSKKNKNAKELMKTAAYILAFIIVAPPILVPVLLLWEYLIKYIINWIRL